MKNNRFFVLGVLAVLLTFGAAQRAEAQRAAAESDFEVGLTNDGAGVVIKNYVGNGGAVIIPATIQGMSVREIGERAFNERSRTITSVTIPNGVTSIGYSAFSGCSSLTSVTIPDSVTVIAERAFLGCTSLASVTLPNSLTSVGKLAFTKCESLASVTLPNSLTSISEWMFNGCKSLKSITIPDSVTVIDEQAFLSCSSLTSVTIGDNIIEIGSHAFGGCSNLVTVTISPVEGRKWNKDYRGAFSSCPKLSLRSQAAIKAAGYPGDF